MRQKKNHFQVVFTIRQHPSESVDGKYQDHLANDGISLRTLDRKTNTTWQRFLFSSCQRGKFKETSAKQGTELAVYNKINTLDNIAYTLYQLVCFDIPVTKDEAMEEITHNVENIKIRDGKASFSIIPFIFFLSH